MYRRGDSRIARLNYSDLNNYNVGRSDSWPPPQELPLVGKLSPIVDWWGVTTLRSTSSTNVRWSPFPSRGRLTDNLIFFYISPTNCDLSKCLFRWTLPPSDEGGGFAKQTRRERKDKTQHNLHFSLPQSPDGDGLPLSLRDISLTLWGNLPLNDKGFTLDPFTIHPHLRGKC